ncbi:MAG: PHP domain-containing protein [Anaerolineaceae bacterium]|nr:PHP domain-containing protein [Anaerolineaceae bacterium]
MRNRQKLLETQLNNFNILTRTVALNELMQLVANDGVTISEKKEIANMHCHTFFSFNGYGYSPSAIAWMAKKMGIKFIGIVDFDVLDGVEEFLEACEIVGVRGSAGLETRVYIPEFSTREINSPGEPGISYHMGLGFTSGGVGSDSKEILDDMRHRAKQRNRGMLVRLNEYLTPLVIDYEREVLPLTPAANATERHMLTAIVKAVDERIDNPDRFWSEKLKISENEILELRKDLPGFKNVVRKKLMKRGGVGYVQPGPDTFPSVDDVHQMILSGGALPCITWLDGTTAGEQAMDEMMALLIEKGAVAVNIVPDRNWNISDDELRRQKVQNLYDFVEMAQEKDLPINVGTEMNAYGLKLVDDFDASELIPVRDAFIDGAYFIYGHTILNRHASLGYQSEWSQKNFKNRKLKNEFYTEIGKRVEPSTTSIKKVQQLNDDLSPEEILQIFM